MRVEEGVLAGGLPYLAIGQGPPLVVLPGLSGSHENPQGLDRTLQLRLYRGYAKHFRVYIVNRRPGLDAGITVGDLADDYADGIAERFDEPVPVIGFSTGGSVALQLGIDHADAVDRLVVVAAAYRLSDEGRSLQRELADLVQSGEKRRASARFAAGLVDNRLLKPIIYLLSWAFGGSLASDDPDDMLRTIAAEDIFDVSGELGRITAPTLVIGGALDTLYTPELFEATAAGIPDSEIRLLSGKGHMRTAGAAAQVAIQFLKSGPSSRVSLPASRGTMPVYVARPTTPGPWPGVVVVSDALGMSSDLRRQADWLASQGYLAAAPDLYYWDGRIRCMFSVIRDAASGSGDVFEDLEAVRTWLVSDPQCTGRVGVIGFCMGGGFAVMLAPTGGYDAASVNYGALPKDAAERLAGSCPIVASYGARDVTLRKAPQQLEEILSDAGVQHDIEVYPEAGHSFMNDHDPREAPMWSVVAGKLSFSEYHEPSAVDARRRIVAFFEDHLG